MHGDAGRCREMQMEIHGGTGRCMEMQGDTGRCRWRYTEVQGGARECHALTLTLTQRVPLTHPNPRCHSLTLTLESNTRAGEWHLGLLS